MIAKPETGHQAHRDWYPPVVIGKGSCQEDVPNGSSLRFEAASCANADHQIRLEFMHCQIGCHSCWYSAHIVYTMQLALPYNTHIADIIPLSMLLPRS